MAYDNNEKRADSVYSQRVRAGKRRTYFFDVRETRGNDYYLTITESRKKFNEDGYDRHKLFLYKEDFNKFLKGMTEAIDYVKTELMPDFDFDVFSHENDDYQPRTSTPETRSEAPTGIAAAATPELDASKEEKPSETPDASDDKPDTPAGNTDTPLSDNPDTSDDNTDSSHKDEHVDKW